MVAKAGGFSMTNRRTGLLQLAAAAAIAITLAPSSASAWWREPDNAFGRLACWYSGGGGPDWGKGPGPFFGYGWPSCDPEAYYLRQRERHWTTKRVLRVRG
jgi:hypothetical protein